MQVLNSRTLRIITLIGLTVLLTSAGCAPQPRGATGPFTVAVLPDTQIYSKREPDLFMAQTAWIRDHVKQENIVFVTQLGDIINDGMRDMPQWEVADKAMSQLDGVVPYGVTIGNHDYDKSGDPAGVATTFIRYFGPERYKNYAWYGGASDNRLNSYQRFTGGGQEFLILHLEGDIPDEAIAWTESVLKKYPTLPAIISTHIYLHGRDGIGRNTHRGFRKGGNSGQEVWDKLIRRQPQIFMVLCGHEGRTDEYYQTSTNDAGETVLEILADFQKRERGGMAFLRLMRFNLACKQLHIQTYSPLLDQYEKDDNSDFTLPLILPACTSSKKVVLRADDLASVHGELAAAQ